MYGASKILIPSTCMFHIASACNPALINEDWPIRASEGTHDLVDAVAVESLAGACLSKDPELNITILRPCNVLGPGVRNTMSLLLARCLAPGADRLRADDAVPARRLLHVDDMAEAVVLAFERNHPGIYNAAPGNDDAYQTTVDVCDGRRLPIPSIPPPLQHLWSAMLNWNAFFLPHRINFPRCPVIVDGRLFRERFAWNPRRSPHDAFGRDRRQQALQGPLG